MNRSDHPDEGRPERYPLHKVLPLKQADLGPSGDVGSSAIGQLFEEARFSARGRITVDELRGPDVGFVLAFVRIDLLAPVRYPGEVDVAIGVASIGRTSLHYESALFQGGHVAAVSCATVAVRDTAAGSALVLGASVRAALEPLMLRDPGCARR